MKTGMPSLPASSHTGSSSGSSILSSEPSALRVERPNPLPISPTPTAPAAISASSCATARCPHPGPTSRKLMPVRIRTLFCMFAVALVKATPNMQNRVRILTGINFRDVGPGWGQRAVAQLDADIAAGAVGVGEIGKGFGLSTRKADGSLLKIDDPELDPVWDEAGKLGIPVFIHTAEPQEFFQPIDYTNERWLELSLFGDRRNGPGTGRPTFEELMSARDNLFKKHPK